MTKFQTFIFRSCP